MTTGAGDVVTGVCHWCRGTLPKSDLFMVLGEVVCIDEPACNRRIDALTTCPCGHPAEQHRAMSDHSICPCGCLTIKDNQGDIVVTCETHGDEALNVR